MRKLKTTILALFFCQLGFAQEIVTDRPDQTESSSTIGKGDLQIETGLLIMESNGGLIERFSGPSALIRLGLLEGLEFRIMTQYDDLKFKETSNNSVKGWSDLQLGAKVQLLQNESKTGVALITRGVIPAAKAGLTNVALGIINKLSISHDVGDNVGIGYNVGYDYIGNTHHLTYSLAFGISLANNLGMYVEPYGFYSESGIFESSFDTGLTLLLHDNFQVDASYGFGINHSMHYVAVGLSWKLPELFNSSD